MIQRSILFDLVFEPLVALFLTSVLLFLNSVAYLIRLAFHNRKADIAPKSLVVVVTGCDTGFGELTAVQLQEAGFNVVAACLTVTGTARIKNLVTLSIVCDITKEDDVARLASATEELCQSRNLKLWAVVNNAVRRLLHAVLANANMICLNAGGGKWCAVGLDRNRYISPGHGCELLWSCYGDKSDASFA